MPWRHFDALAPPGSAPFSQRNLRVASWARPKGPVRERRGVKVSEDAAAVREAVKALQHRLPGCAVLATMGTLVGRK
jgi:hypothetical protein